MKIYDISMPVSYDMPVYKGKDEKRPIITVRSDFSNAAVFESGINMNMHTGTHVDCPLHIFEGGSTVDQIDLSKVVTKCKVLDFVDVENKISIDDLEKKNIERGDFVLLKTKNSTSDILEAEYIFLDKSGAEYLESKGVIGVGIDALGIERSQPDHETHKILLGSDIVIIEGLRLAEIEAGEYMLVAAPILIPCVEAAPVRAVLIQDI